MTCAPIQCYHTYPGVFFYDKFATSTGDPFLTPFYPFLRVDLADCKAYKTMSNVEITQLGQFIAIRVVKTGDDRTVFVCRHGWGVCRVSRRLITAQGTHHGTENTILRHILHHYV